MVFMMSYARIPFQNTEAVNCFKTFISISTIFVSFICYVNIEYFTTETIFISTIYNMRDYVVSAYTNSSRRRELYI